MKEVSVADGGGRYRSGFRTAAAGFTWAGSLVMVVVLVLTLLANAVALLGELVVVGVSEGGGGEDGTAWRDQTGGERAWCRPWLDR